MTTEANTQGRDLHVVERILKGDAEVYRVLVERYRPNALAHAYAMIGDAGVAESVVDETFLMAFNTLSQISDRSDFRSFFYEALRKKLRMPAMSARSDSRVLEAEREVLKNVMTDRIRNLEVAPAVRQVLLGVGVERREAWSLRYVAGLTFEEIARLVGKTLDVVEGHVREVGEALVGAGEKQTALDDASSPSTHLPALDDVVPPPLMPEREESDVR